MIPSEDSSGAQRRQGSITKAGNSSARRALIWEFVQYYTKILPGEMTTTCLICRAHSPNEPPPMIAPRANGLGGRYGARIFMS